MHTVGAFEAKTHFSALLEEVEKGEQIIITKHGRAVAQLSPVAGINKTRIQEAVRTINELQCRHTLGLDWKTLRDEGRK